MINALSPMASEMFDVPQLPVGFNFAGNDHTHNLSDAMNLVDDAAAFDDLSAFADGFESLDIDIGMGIGIGPPFPFTSESLYRNDAAANMFGLDLGRFDDSTVSGRHSNGHAHGHNQPSAVSIMAPIAAPTPPTLRRQGTTERFDELLRRALTAGDAESGADGQVPGLHVGPTQPQPRLPSRQLTTVPTATAAPTAPTAADALLMSNPLTTPLSRGASREDMLLLPRVGRYSESPASRSGSPASSAYSSSPGSPQYLDYASFGRSTSSSPSSPPSSPSISDPNSFIVRRRLQGASTDPKHSVGRNHICGQCNARFLCKSKLDRHVLTHTGAKPFDCFCGKRFNQKSALKNHTRRHLRKRDHLFDAERCGLNGFSHESLSPESVQHFP
eukprot:m.169931 g.169931  ORF g.169931 m.169931 type:complete len:387 (+) comp24180_c0_seq2:281-1441(+)